MTKKVLIICAGGMSSSLIAKQTMDKLVGEGKDVFVEACGTGSGRKRIEENTYDLYLISPQTRMYFKDLKAVADKAGSKIDQIPPQAYVPIPTGINNMAKLVEKNIELEKL
ncbi:MAG: PTS cellobiose transporter subunit IIB [Faecalicoccus sp.]|nr:PTS cellobiose transporter subunit IIB [Faecalicoccus sp.]